MQSYGGSEIARNCVQRAGILVSTVQSGASGYEKGFVKWYLKVPLACLGSTAAAVQPNGLWNSQKTVYKTFFTT